MTKDDLVSKDTALKMAIETMTLPNNLSFLMAITACKEALEQPAQEPVAWNEEEFNAIAYAYRAFPSSEVKMVSEKYKALVDYVLSIANHAPSWQGNKEFVGLSDDEIAKIIGKGAFYEWNDVEFARAIEQALKDKNT